ncbi:MAG TPA: 23S rRNA (adenine(2503)-C(2))-methyltransferase RlmN, partial [Rhodobiaceae bacterium]|nr:23S rRNA (adenine(2503)-C(2))-methyltransferase RlmN [Rhodobiaceae bacterium]
MDDTSGPRKSLCGASKPALDAALLSAGVSEKQIKMRRQQIWSWLYAHGVAEFDAMHNVAKAVRAGLAENFTLDRLTTADAQYSDDGTRK